MTVFLKVFLKEFAAKQGLDFVDIKMSAIEPNETIDVPYIVDSMQVTLDKFKQC